MPGTHFRRQPTPPRRYRTPPTRVTDINVNDLKLDFGSQGRPNSTRTAAGHWTRPSQRPPVHQPPPGLFPEFRADRAVTMALKVSPRVQRNIGARLALHGAVAADVDIRSWGRPGDEPRQFYPAEEARSVPDLRGWSAKHYALLPRDLDDLLDNPQYVVSHERLWDMERRFDLPAIKLSWERRDYITYVDAGPQECRKGEDASMERQLLENISDGHWLLSDLSGHFYLAEGGMLLSLPGQEAALVRRADIIPTLLHWATPLRCTMFTPTAKMVRACDLQRMLPRLFNPALQVALDAVETAWPQITRLAGDFRRQHGIAPLGAGPGIVFTQARTLAGAPWPYATLRSEVWCSDWERGQLIATGHSADNPAPLAQGRPTPLPWTREAARYRPRYR